VNPYRRWLSVALGTALARVGKAQTARPKRLGWLNSGYGPDHPRVREAVDVVVTALRAKGWILGENYLIEFRFARGDPDRYPPMVDELLAWKPDVLFGLETAANVAVTRTRSIPIVLATSVDPVAAGLVDSLARPGTNVTGMANMADLLTAKQVELLAELVPQARRIALLIDSRWAGVQATQQHATAAARVRGLAMEVVPVAHAAEVRAAFVRFGRERVDALAVATTPGTYRLGPEIRQGALSLRMPVVGFVEQGAVAEYSPDFLDQFRESADFIDAIFRGANPAELPIRQATRFLLSVNPQAARAIGLTLPQSVLLRADRVIE
jgi:putative ABC transport system substrate-binding protein